MSETNTRSRILVMFSGGKDSFVTACRLVADGDYVGLISFNNGSVMAEQNFAHGAARLVNRFGEDRIHFEGVYNTAAILMSLKKWYVDQTHETLVAHVPDVSPTQMTCFHCQTAMWIAAIAYAKSKDFDIICTGYRDTDEFCTGTEAYLDLVRNLADSQDILIDVPVWHHESSTMSWNVARDTEMSRRRFIPSVYEPKCILGMPSAPLTRAAQSSLMQYYENILSGLVKEEIEKMIPIFDHMELGPSSMIIPEIPVPDPKGTYC